MADVKAEQAQTDPASTSATPTDATPTAAMRPVKLTVEEFNRAALLAHRRECEHCRVNDPEDCPEIGEIVRAWKAKRRERIRAEREAAAVREKQADKIEIAGLVLAAVIVVLIII